MSSSVSTLLKTLPYSDWSKEVELVFLSQNDKKIKISCYKLEFRLQRNRRNPKHFRLEMKLQLALNGCR